MTLALKALTYTALAFGLGAVLTGCTNSYKVQKIETAFPPVGQFVEVTGGKVHYVQDGAGPDVILIHGAGGNLRDFTYDLMGRLTDRYRVTAFDRPGHGYTDRVPGIATGAFASDGDSPTAQANMLREAAQKLGVTDPIVAGHSFGGIVALAWAVGGLDQKTDQDAKGIVSFAGVSMPWPDPLGAYYTVNGSALGGAIVVPVLSAVATDQIVTDAVAGTFAPQTMPDDYAAHLGAPLVLRPDSFRANVRQVNTLRPKVVTLSQRYPELTLPIEILHGTVDTTVPIHVHSREIVKIAPTVRVTELAGVGHQPHHADPEAAVAAIDRAAARAGLR